MIRNLAAIVACHAIGDYLFQSDYLAANKGKDWYLLFIHAVLYCAPYSIWFRLGWKILVLFAAHFVVDALKARYHKINLLQDQIIHYIVAALLFVR